jgi:hypothetical protein
MKKYVKTNRAENTGKPPVRKSASWVPFSSLSLPVEAKDNKTNCSRARFEILKVRFPWIFKTCDTFISVPGHSIS